jgi:flagellar biosynthesis protein FliR
MNPFAATLDGGQVASLFLVLLRCTGFIVTAPILGHRAIPRPAKAGLAALLAVTLAGRATAAAGAAPFIVAAPIELLIGVTMGLSMALAFTALETIARLVSIQMGLSLGAVFDPVGGEASTPLGPLFAAMSALLFMALNLHLAIVRVLGDSFATLPIGGQWPTGLFGAAANLAALALELSARVAMPLALVLLLVELSVALISRAIPQINVFFLGLPLKILVGIALIAVSLPTILGGMSGILRFVVEGVASATVTGAPAVTPLPSMAP